MLLTTAKLPLREPLTCDECGVAKLTLAATTFDDAWREVHQVHGWMLMGAGRRSWRVLCPRCKPQGGAGDLGPRGGAGGG